FQAYRLTAPGFDGLIAGTPAAIQQQCPDSETQLTLLGDSFSGYSSLRALAAEQVLPGHDLGLCYQQELDQGQRAAQLGQGADLIVTTLDQYLTHRPAGKIVGLIDRTIGADAAVLNTSRFPQLKSLDDLATLRAQHTELKLVYAAGTPSEYLARLLDIKFEQFNLADFQVVEVEDSPQAYQLLQEDPSVAVAVLWEPDVSQALQAGNTVALSSQDVPYSIIDVMVASDGLLAQPEVLQAVMTAYYQHADVLMGAPLINQIATDGGLSPEEAEAVLGGIDFFTSQEAGQWFTDGTLDKRIRSTEAILALAGEPVASADPTSLYDPSFIEAAIASSQRRIEAIKAADPDLAAQLTQGAPATPTVSPQRVQAAAAIGNLNVRGTVEFTTGTITLTPEGQRTLDQLAQELADFSPATTALSIVGHTSKTGPADFNQTLSEQRAQVVASYLKRRGINLQVVSQGVGFTQPLPGIDPASPQNQRTDVTLKRIGG
ncbi:MAG: phosphate ABC transporter substrate-binding/OmpA family protein, partial [Cyanobacteria bacterium P01_A01_bin.135]